MKRILALLNLVLSGIWHFLKLPLRLGGPSKEAQRFLDQYAADGVTAMSAQERAHFASFENCLSCGLCHASCTQPGRIPRDEFPSPEYLVHFTRNQTLLAKSRVFAAHFDGCATCADGERCESVCPTQVPIRDIAAFVRARSQR